MKTNLTLINSDFKVENNVVFCKQYYCMHLMFYPSIDKYFSTEARATCSEKDTFDVKKGMRIAECRARMKAYKHAYNMCHQYAHKLSTALTTTSKNKVALNIQYKTTKEYLESIY